MTNPTATPSATAMPAPACGATYPALALVCTLPSGHADAHEAPCTDPGWELSTMAWGN